MAKNSLKRNKKFVHLAQAERGGLRYAETNEEEYGERREKKNAAKKA